MSKTRWMMVIALIIAAWLAVMVGASYLSYENKLPVRIENWKPEPAR
jgi:hypothetical protein